MEFDHDRLAAIAQELQFAGRTAPLVVIQAFASLVGERNRKSVAISRTSSTEGTEWRVMALLSRGIVTLRASAAEVDWVYDSAADKDGTGELHEARYVPLSEIASCSVVGIRKEPQSAISFSTDSVYRWHTDWAVTLRSGETVAIPSDRDGATSKAIAQAVQAELES